MDHPVDAVQLRPLSQSAMDEAEAGYYQQPTKRAWWVRLLDTAGLMPLRQRHLNTYEPSNLDSPGVSPDSDERFPFPSACPPIARRRAVIGMLKGACIILPIVILVLL